MSQTNETNEQWALRIASEFVNNSGVMGKELDTQFLALAIERAIMRGYIQGAEFALDAFKGATEPKAETQNTVTASKYTPRGMCKRCGQTPPSELACDGLCGLCHNEVGKDDSYPHTETEGAMP